MTSRHAVFSVVAAGYIAGGFFIESEPSPWGAPRPEAEWIKFSTEDPRPFWARLLLSLRWDFEKNQLTGAAEF
jgi:hypothetical protein